MFLVKYICDQDCMLCITRRAGALACSATARNDALFCSGILPDERLTNIIVPQEFHIYHTI